MKHQDEVAFSQQGSKFNLSNPLKPLGLLSIATSIVVCLLALLSLVVHKMDNLAYAMIMIVFAIVLAIYGLTRFMSTLDMPKGAPAGIFGIRRKVGDLLSALVDDSSYLGTYERPKGFVNSIIASTMPRLLYMTPISKTIIRRLVSMGVILFFSICVAAINIYFAAYIAACLSLLFGCLLFFSTAFALWNSAPKRPGETPKIESATAKLRSAGNPIGLIQNIKSLTEDLRSGDLSRFYSDAPEKLNAKEFGKFDGVAMFETRPVLVQSSPSYIRTATLVEYIACGGVLFFALFALYAKPTLENSFAKAFYTVFSMLTAVCLLPIAVRLRTCFRFVSQLFAIWLDGNYQHGSSGYQGTSYVNVNVVSSDIDVKVMAADVETECHNTNQLKLLSKISNVDQELRAASISLGAPRYILRTIDEGNVREQLDQLIKSLVNYRDKYLDAPDIINYESSSVGILKSQEQQKVQSEHLQKLMIEKAIAAIQPQQALELLAKSGVQVPNLPSTNLPVPSHPQNAPATSAKSYRHDDIVELSTLPDEIMKKLCDSILQMLDTSLPLTQRQQSQSLVNQIKKQYSLSSDSLHALRKKISA